jgi:hypothetical protein
VFGRHVARACRERGDYSGVGQLWARGDAPAGSVLYIYDHTGMGDCFQFLRYLPLVKARAGVGVRVVFFCREFSYAFGAAICERCGVDILPLPKGGDVSALDLPPDWNGLCQSSLIRLPLVLGPLGMDEPYIIADTERQSEWQGIVGNTGVLQVAICHQASQIGTGADGRKARCKFTDAENRIAPAGVFERLAASMGDRVQFHLLMPRAEEGAPRIRGASDHGHRLRNWQDTAAALSVMDLTITVDTALCHVAGAMGEPVWTLVPHSSCWRWGTDPESTAWYPSMKLYRHQQVGDWKDTTDRVIADLEILLASRHSRPDITGSNLEDAI